jgi:hypothetical protein
MKIQIHGVLVLSLGLIVATASGVVAQPPPAGMPPGAMPGIPAVDPEIAKPMVLTDAQVNGFLGAVEDFDAMEKKSGDRPKRDPSTPADFTRNLADSAEAQAILTKHGFSDPLEFQRVAYNAAMAYGVLEQGGKKVVQQKLSDAKSKQAKAMEQMKQHLSPEQLKAMQGQMNAGMAIADSMGDVPDENLTLMEKYRDRMAKLSKK